MHRSKLLIPFAVFALIASGCTSERAHRKHDGPASGEAPLLRKSVDGPGAGYVFGTADFELGGVVQVKLQIEAKSIPNTEDQATITAWSGSGQAPQNMSELPPAAGMFYDSGGDVDLKHWTTHIVRQHQGNPLPPFWVVVKVDRKGSAGHPRDVTWHGAVWSTPDTSDAPQDPPTPFVQY